MPITFKYDIQHDMKLVYGGLFYIAYITIRGPHDDFTLRFTLNSGLIPSEPIVSAINKRYCILLGVGAKLNLFLKCVIALQVISNNLLRYNFDSEYHKSSRS